MDLERELPIIESRSEGIEGVAQVTIKLHRALLEYFRGITIGTEENHEGYSDGFIEAAIGLLELNGPSVVHCVIGTDDQFVDGRVTTGRNIVRSIRLGNGIVADLHPETVLRLISEEELDRLALASMLYSLRAAEVDARAPNCPEAQKRLKTLQRVYGVNIAQILECYGMDDPRSTDGQETMSGED